MFDALYWAAIGTNQKMSFESPSGPVPIPARLVERALDLARAEVGLALVHTRRIAVRAVSALLGTIVACAFAQLTVVLLVAWPVIAGRVPTLNLVAGVGISIAMSLAGAVGAFVVWVGASEKKAGPAGHPSAVAPEAERASPSVTASPRPVSDAELARNAVVSRQRRFDTREEPPVVTIGERVGS